MRRYNADVTPKLVIPLLLGIAVVACNRAPESKEAVREGIVDHLNKNTGLDLKAMDVDIRDVTFKGNQATASVAFKPKSSPDAGMTMNYTLERQGKNGLFSRKREAPATPARWVLAGGCESSSAGGSWRSSVRPPTGRPTSSSRRSKCPESLY